ncbi:MAG: VWA domain-containing protein [Alphaproteobacteria bacterium]|nr:VWA domain-containing protein [Alphaproteobacteria bacterium]
MNPFGLINPMLLWGGLAVALPIVIHLLNRRRFRTVDWAAMDFLLEADRRNRRRIRLEHLLLLLLRCLAIVLIALLVARLFVMPGGASLLAAAAQTQRIVLLDDSASMTARLDNRNAFAKAQQTLERFVRGTATQRPGDTFTLVLTSRPDQPILNGRYFEQAQTMVDRIAKLEPADRPAALGTALSALGEVLDEDADAAAANRVVYVMTDLRQRDWGAAAAPQREGRSVAERLADLAERVDGVVIVPIDEADTANLGVTGLAPQEKTVVQGVPVRFEATVRNFGSAPASDVKVTFTAGHGPPLTRTVDHVPAGAAASVPFTFTFGAAGSVPVRAAIGPDVMPADNVRRYAARVQAGVDVLVVDGDPSVEFGRGESFFLARALSPPGEIDSGYKLDVVTENQLAAVDFGDYQLVVLANVYQVPPPQLDALERWVGEGGGLAVFLGDQVDRTIYNQQLHRAGRGVLPARLVRVRGEQTDRTWVMPGEVAPGHPVTGLFAGDGNPLLQRIKVFRWWAAATGDDPNVTVPASLNDSERSPLLIEKSVGRGRSLLVTTSADGDWTAWPSDPSYVVALLEMARHLARPTAPLGNVATGQALARRLDVSRFDPRVEVLAPGAGEPTTVRAVAPQDQAPNAGRPDAGVATRTVVFGYDRTHTAGFYRARFKRHAGEDQTVLFAANLDPTEGELAPLDRAARRSGLVSERVQLAEGAAVMTDIAGGGRVELWRPIGVVLLVVLMAEQTLAWWFGQRRSAA